MSNENSDESEQSDQMDQVRTSIEIDRQVWRQVRAEAVGDGKNISDKLEEILKEYFGDSNQ